MAYDTYHLTVAFLGDITETDASQVVRILDATAQTCQAPLLSPCGLGKFGKAHNATLFLQLQAHDSLITLAQSVREQLDARSIYFDKKKFKPHITLARRATLQKDTLEHLAFPTPDAAPTLSFYKSILKPEGAEYKELYSVTLPHSSRNKQS